MMQEDRSQHRNRAKAMAVLRTRLYDHERQKLDSARAAARRGQVGSGDRSERIRTYNFPQGRVSDHRINLTLYKLPQIIEGEALGEIIDALVHRASGRVAGRRKTRDAPMPRHDVAQARRALAAQFRDAGLDIARARCAHPGRPRARARPCRRWWPRRRSRSPRARQRGSRGCAARRLAGEPVARIVGAKEFWGLSLHRHARRAGAAAGDRDRGRAGARAHRSAADARTRALRIADLGTGSGAILLALLTRTAERRRRRHRHRRAGARRRAAQCAKRSASRRARRSCAATTAARCTGRSISSCRTRPTSRRRDIAALAPRGARSRSAACARRRRGRACGLSGDRRRCAAPARARRPPGGRDRGRASSARSSACSPQGGLQSTAVRHDLSGHARGRLRRTRPAA